MNDMVVCPRADIELAHLLATTADRIAVQHFERSLTVTNKGDGSPVTQADLAVEQAMVDLLARHRPDDGVLSEEAGAVRAGRRRWLLDPIDGTAGFIAGSHHWGTHVALEIDGHLVLGMITRPVGDQRWWAAAGHGAFRSSTTEPMASTTPLAVSTRSTLDGARVGLFTNVVRSQVRALLARHGAEVVRASPERSTILELIEGELDAVVSESAGAAWDHAPAIVLTIQAGGSFVDPSGTCRPDLLGGMYGNQLLDDQLRAALAGTQPVGLNATAGAADGGRIDP